MPESEIPLAVPCIGGNAAAYLQQCLDTNFVSSVGPFVERFESEFAAAVGARHAVACSSGTAAIHVALQVAGIEAGDEVLVSDFTFIATVNPIRYLGAQPILVDADAQTWNLNPHLIIEELERRVASRRALPKAILAAHVLGLPADLEPLIAACEKYAIILIEDAAESLGAGWKQGALAGRQTGTVGKLGCYSFNGNKIMTTGGGGMIVTDDATLAKRAKHLTTQAKLPGAEYLHDEIGFNYRLTNLAAALGVAQLEQLPHFIARKREIAARYDQALNEIAALSLAPRPPWSEPTMWLYSVLVDAQIAGSDRQGISAQLGAQGIQTRPLWAPAHVMPFYRDVQRLGGEVGAMLFGRGLSLPCSIGLTHAEQERVIAGLNTLLA